MKRILASASMVALLSNTSLLAQQKDYAVISGTIKNAPMAYVVIERAIQPVTKKDTVQLDANGAFTFKTNEPNTLQVYRVNYSFKQTHNEGVQAGASTLVVPERPDKFDLLISNGFNINLYVDAKDKENTLKVTGYGSEACRYYADKLAFNTKFNTIYLKMQRAPKDSLLDYLNTYDKALNELRKKYTLDKLPYVPNEYVQHEIQNQQFNMARMKWYYAQSQINRHKNDSILAVFESDPHYFDFQKDLPFGVLANKDNPNYVQMISIYTEYIIAKNNKGIKPTDADKFTQKYECYKSIFTSNELRDFMMYEMLDRYNIRATEPWFQSCVTDFNKIASSDSLKAEINNTLLVRKQMAKGNPAPDFVAFDAKGNQHMLSDFKGQYVVIDGWATWCKPCVAEIPYVKKTEKDFEGKNIVFLSISIDNDSTRWRKYVESKGMTGHQLWVGNNKTKGFNKDYLVFGIPRFIFIDPQGNFIDAQLPRPSYPEFQNIMRQQKDLIQGQKAKEETAETNGGQ